MRLTPIQAEHLGNIIRNKRLIKGLTAKQIEKETSISQSQISRFENGNFQVLSNNMQKICNYLGVNVQIEVNSNRNDLILQRVQNLLTHSDRKIELLINFLDAIEGGQT